MNSTTDRDGCALLEAERELRTLVIVLDVVPLSDVARVRVNSALATIGAALSGRRPEVGLPVRQRAAA